MFLTVHAATGAFIGQHSPGMIVAFLLGIISHFILDMVPHGDDALEVWHSHGKTKRVYFIATLDSILTIILILYLFKYNEFAYPKVIIMGILGGILPDIINSSYLVLKSNKWWIKNIAVFHQKMHNSIGRKFRNKFSLGKKASIIAGLLLQAFVLWILLT